MWKGGQHIHTSGSKCNLQHAVTFMWHDMLVRIKCAIFTACIKCEIVTGVRAGSELLPMCHVILFYEWRSRMQTLYFQQIYSVCPGSATSIGHCPILFDSFLMQHLISYQNMSRETWMASEAIKLCAGQGILHLVHLVLQTLADVGRRHWSCVDLCQQRQSQPERQIWSVTPLDMKYCLPKAEELLVDYWPRLTFMPKITALPALQDRA